MDTTKSIFATLFIFALIGGVVWGGMWAYGYVHRLLAPVTSTTMAVVIAGWIGLWGAALIVVFGLRIARGKPDRTQRQKVQADVYAYLLDALSGVETLDQSVHDSEQTVREAEAEVRASLRQAERHLILHGSSNVIEAYEEIRESEESHSSAVHQMLVQMRRDLGHSTFGLDRNTLLRIPSLGEDSETREGPIHP